MIKTLLTLFAAALPIMGFAQTSTVEYLDGVILVTHSTGETETIPSELFLQPKVSPLDAIVEADGILEPVGSLVEARAAVTQPVTLPYVTTVRVANHQELARDPNFPQGFSFAFDLPPLPNTVQTITWKVDSSNVAYWRWENLSDQWMNSTTTGAPIATITAKHILQTRKPDNTGRVLAVAPYSQISYSQYGSCSSPGLAPFDGTIDANGPSGWSYSCPGDCVSYSNSGTTTYVTQFGGIPYSEKQMWYAGKKIVYTPDVSFYSPFPLCPSNVTWETNHDWFNYSDMRSTVDVTITIE